MAVPTMVNGTEPRLEPLLAQLLDSEIIRPSSSLYAAETSTWAAQKNQHPQVVLRPSSTQSLAKILAHVSSTDLDISIRGSGNGSASAKDVLVSMAAFDEFDFDKESEILTLGAGQLWRDYYEKMEKVAPEYHVVAARTPALSVGGSIIGGGFSWLARQYGNTSDPVNFLDAECVLPSGRVLWASEEPDLLWALRGGGGSFCAVTRLKLRAYKYTQDIFAGSIIVPRRHLDLVVTGIADMQRRATEEEIPPQVSMDLYVVTKDQAAHMGAKEDLLIVQTFDALGEKHGRSQDGFRWALDIPDAMDMTKTTNLRGTSQMHEQTAAMKSAFKSYWYPLTLGPLTSSTIHNTLKWFDSVVTAGGTVANSVQIVFECLCTRDSSNPAAESAWPRPKGIMNTIIVAAGCDGKSGSEEEQETARKLVEGAPGLILGEEMRGKGVRVAPNAVEEFHDLQEVFAENLPKLLELKKKYDPNGKLKGPIHLPKTQANGKA